MDDQYDTPDLDDETQLTSSDATDESDPRVQEASLKYLASWNHLVSTTNWEKGHIINQWRESLEAIGASASEYSDDAWARRVGNVTPQHVGRLRRVYSRFFESYKQYKGLYWSHFQAALDWDDPEMWLEGAVQSNWSVAAMRQKRWESVGAPADQKPRDEDVILAELDEDVSATDDFSTALTTDNHVVQPLDDDPFSEANHELAGDGSDSLDADMPLETDAARDPLAEPVRPFEDMPSLPSDLREAVESMKLAIVSHKLAGWRDVRCDDVLAALNALKQLALAPSDD